MTYIYKTIRHNQAKYMVYYLYKKKKIYLGFYNDYEEAVNAYDYAGLLFKSSLTLHDYTPGIIDFQKFVSLINFRDSDFFIKHPIYLFEDYFEYHIDPETVLYFDSKDLFFFSTHKIYKRGHYFYTLRGHTQESILKRFLPLPKGALGTDYYFINNNPLDFRRENLKIINSFQGVRVHHTDSKTLYTTRIILKHPLVVGRYKSEIEAAIAYNKAIDVLRKTGIKKDYTHNEIPYLTRHEYKEIYDSIVLSPRLKHPSIHKRVVSNKTYRGVFKDRNGFRACIGYDKKQIHLGNYPTEIRAAQAYNYASLYLYGPSGYTNPLSPLVCDHDLSHIASKLQKAGLIKKKKLE